MIVVTGATGTLGPPLVALLKDQGVAVRAVARSAEVGTLPAGVEVHRADLTRPEDVAPALETASEQILGRPARSLAGWVADHADVFRGVAS